MVSRTVGNFVHLGRWVGGLIIVSVSQDIPNYVSQEQLGRVSVCSEDETAGEGDGKPSENRKTEFPPPPTTPPSPSRARTRSRYQPRGDLREQTGGQTDTFCFFYPLRWLGGLLSEEDLFESDRRDFFLCRKGALERARGARHQHQQGCG